MGKEAIKRRREKEAISKNVAKMYRKREKAEKKRE